MSSANHFATVVALILTVFLAPAIYDQLNEYSWRYAVRMYGRDMASLIDGLFFLACFPLTFFALRASLATAIATVALYGAMRLV